MKRAEAVNHISDKYCADVLSPGGAYGSGSDVSLLYAKVNEGFI
jgi:hypothetical protein